MLTIKPETRRALLAGGISGIAEACVTQPFEVTKNRIQLGHGPRGVYSNMADTVARRGAGGLYYGLQPQLVQVSSKAAIRFAAVENFKRILPPGSTFTAGTLAGLTEAVVIVAPTERLKVLRTSELGGLKGVGSSSVFRAAVLVFRDQGLAGLWTGTGPTAARQALANGIRFALYDKFKKALPTSLGALGSVIAGALTGIASTVITNPIDVVKTRIQSAPVERGAASLSVLRSVRELLRSEGLMGLTRGTGARAVKIGIGQAIIFGVYEQVKPHC